MQFDSHPQSSRRVSFLIPFNSCPMAPLQDHAQALGEEILGKNPQLMFETHSEFFIPQIGTQLSRPPVPIQPDGGDLTVCVPRRQPCDYPSRVAVIRTVSKLMANDPP